VVPTAEDAKESIFARAATGRECAFPDGPKGGDACLEHDMLEKTTLMLIGGGLKKSNGLLWQSPADAVRSAPKRPYVVQNRTASLPEHLKTMPFRVLGWRCLRISYGFSTQRHSPLMLGTGRAWT